jgi:glutathione S-transferase
MRHLADYLGSVVVLYDRRFLAGEEYTIADIISYP